MLRAYDRGLGFVFRHQLPMLLVTFVLMGVTVVYFSTNPLAVRSLPESKPHTSNSRTYPRR